MEFFGIGTWELILIGIIALAVLGPKQMILVARKAGEYLRQLQIMWREASKTLEKEIRAIENEAPELTKLPGEIKAIGSELNAALNLVNRPDGKSQPASSAAPPPSASPATAAAPSPDPETSQSKPQPSYSAWVDQSKK